jgi:hypothetical protein
MLGKLARHIEWRIAHNVFATLRPGQEITLPIKPKATMLNICAHNLIAVAPRRNQDISTTTTWVEDPTLESLNVE